MIRTLGTVKDFLKIREKCIFCQTPLTPMLANAMGVSGLAGRGIPKLKANLENNCFTSSLKYYGDRVSFEGTVVIDLDRNTVWYRHDNTFLVSLNDVLDTFKDMHPYIQLGCENKKCKLDYSLNSDPFNFDLDLSIYPVGPFTESFTFDNLWVCNHYLHDYTMIYHKNNLIGATPLVVDWIDFNSFAPSKLLTRIKTISVFS
jgi:hypothetical protein